jgi:hypothetical protein
VSIDHDVMQPQRHARHCGHDGVMEEGHWQDDYCRYTA